MKKYLKGRFALLITAAVAIVAFAFNHESVISACCCGWCCGLTYADAVDYYFRNK